MKLWLARDKNENLRLFEEEPIYSEIIETWLSSSDYSSYLCYLDEAEFPEITFHNSPQEVELKLVKEE